MRGGPWWWLAAAVWAAGVSSSPAWAIVPARVSPEATGGAGSSPSPDPAPYDRVFQCVEWSSHRGDSLSFALVGWSREERARTVAVYRKSAAGWNRVFLDRDRGFHPWKIALADLDGDSVPEVLLGVYKASRFDPVVRNRLFVLAWTREGVLFPRWLGSRLGGPLVDFRVLRVADGRDLVISVERVGADEVRSFANRWSGFGFTRDPDSMEGR